MEAEFWNQRWQNNQIAFHQGRVNHLLHTCFDKLALSPGDCVFVPLCGKTIDMRWLIDRGYKVVGVELSAVAVRDFFAEQSLSYQIRETDNFTVYENESIALWCGDFFLLADDMPGEYAAIYDRAALIALPDAMRTRYVDHLLHISEPGTPLLLLTYEYPQQETEGPPFSVGVEEIRRYFGNHRSVHVLESRDVLEQEAQLRERGLTRLVEHAFLISPKD